MNIQKLANEIHSIAKEKGFWDEPRNFDECVMLIISELGEALEAHRRGKYAQGNKFTDKHEYDKSVFSEEHSYKTNFETYIKDSFSDELADVAIRLMDLMAGFGFPLLTKDEITEILRQDEEYSFAIEWPENIGACLRDITTYVIQIHEWQKDSNIERVLPSYAVWIIIDFANHLSIDLRWHILAKMRYNQGRDRLHGKSY